MISDRWQHLSIRNRLLFASFPLLLIFLLLSGTGLFRAYERTAVEAEFERLQLQLWSLMADAEFEGRTLAMPESLLEPAFSLPESNIVGLIHNQSGEQIWASLSAEFSGSLVTAFEAKLAPMRAGTSLIARGSAGEFMVRQAVTFLDDNSQKSVETVSVVFSVIDRGADYQQQLQGYLRLLVIWLAMTGVSLLLLQWLILRWGLFPLTRLRGEIEDIEAGREERFTAVYPVEIQTVTDSLNQLVASQKRQSQRYRNTLDDLAHSLKTPLAALQAIFEVSKNSTDDGTGTLIETDVMLQCRNQIERMDDTISRQLGRAAQGGGNGFSRTAVPVRPLADRLLSALNTVYADRDVKVESVLPTNTTVLVEQSDLMEVLGNLLDNAYKYCAGSVRFAVTQHTERRAEQQVDTGATVRFVIEDNGPGIDTDTRERALARGVRFDTRREGQGLGLAAAAEILDAYGVELKIDVSPLGGARLSFLLPAPIPKAALPT